MGRPLGAYGALSSVPKLPGAIRPAPPGPKSPSLLKPACATRVITHWLAGVIMVKIEGQVNTGGERIFCFFYPPKGNDLWQLLRRVKVSNMTKLPPGLISSGKPPADLRDLNSETGCRPKRNWPLLKRMEPQRHSEAPHGRQPLPALNRSSLGRQPSGAPSLKSLAHRSDALQPAPSQDWN